MTVDLAEPSALVVVEGVNGAGKTTVAEYLARQTGAKLFHFPPEFVRFRHEAKLDVRVGAVARLGYYLGASVHLSDLVQEALEAGPVICDRYLAAPLSLLVAEAALTAGEVAELSSRFEEHVAPPALTLLLTAATATVSARIVARVPTGPLTGPERMTVESASFAADRQVALRYHSRRLGPVVELDTTYLGVAAMLDRAERMVASSLSRLRRSRVPAGGVLPCP